MTQPFEALNLPEIPTWDDDYADVTRDLVIAVQGSVFHGYTTDAIMHTLRWLRANPQHAAVLLTHGLEG